MTPCVYSLGQPSSVPLCLLEFPPPTCNLTSIPRDFLRSLFLLVSFIWAVTILVLLYILRPQPSLWYLGLGNGAIAVLPRA